MGVKPIICTAILTKLCRRQVAPALGAALEWGDGEKPKLYAFRLSDPLVLVWPLPGQVALRRGIPLIILAGCGREDCAHVPTQIMVPMDRVTVVE